MDPRGSNLTGHKGTYDFSRLAAREQVVVVVINYRLGPFGWFAHPALNGENLTEPALANFGTLDMIEALRWTQTNIAQFGGDPANVTVFGRVPVVEMSLACWRHRLPMDCFTERSRSRAMSGA